MPLAVISESSGFLMFSRICDTREFVMQSLTTKSLFVDLFEVVVRINIKKIKHINITIIKQTKKLFS